VGLSPTGKRRLITAHARRGPLSPLLKAADGVLRTFERVKVVGN
jgi:hypothetical protein